MTGILLMAAAASAKAVPDARHRDDFSIGNRDGFSVDKFSAGAGLNLLTDTLQHLWDVHISILPDLIFWRIQVACETCVGCASFNIDPSPISGDQYVLAQLYAQCAQAKGTLYGYKVI